jgi:hypothetical protein
MQQFATGRYDSLERVIKNYVDNNQRPYFSMAGPILDAISPCFEERVFLTIPGIDPDKSASEM